MAFGTIFMTSTQQEASGPTDLINAIAEAAAGFEGRLAFFAKDLASGKSASFNADIPMNPASVIKVPILVELYRRADEGRVDLDEVVVLSAGDWMPGSGVLRHLSPGCNFTLRDLARLMIIVSDNVATRLVLMRTGIESVNRTAAHLGLSSTRYELTQGERGTYGSGTSTARDLARLMELVASDAILTPAACAEMRDHLSRQFYLDQAARYLPYGPYLGDSGIEQPLRLMNKTGFAAGAYADAAIVVAPNTTLVLAAMCDGGSDRGYHSEHEALRLMGAVARLAFDHWVGPLDVSPEAEPFLRGLMKASAGGLAG